MGKTVGNRTSSSPAPVSRLADKDLDPEQILALENLDGQFSWPQELQALARDPDNAQLDKQLAALLDAITSWQEPFVFQRLRSYLPALAALPDKTGPSGPELKQALVHGQIGQVLTPLAASHPDIDLAPLAQYQNSSLVDRQFQRAIGQAVAQVYYQQQEVYGPEGQGLPAESVVQQLIGVGLSGHDDYFHVRLADLQGNKNNADEQRLGSTHYQLSVSRLIHNINNDLGYGLVALSLKQRSLREINTQLQDGKFALLDQLISCYQ
jgi:hypothetical protein